MRCWHGNLSREKCKWLAYGLADATATPSSLLQKIQNGLSFWYWPTQVVLEKRPLNDRACVCVLLHLCSPHLPETIKDDLSYLRQITGFERFNQRVLIIVSEVNIKVTNKCTRTARQWATKLLTALQINRKMQSSHPILRHDSTLQPKYLHILPEGILCKYQSYDVNYQKLHYTLVAHKVRYKYAVTRMSQFTRLAAVPTIHHPHHNNSMYSKTLIYRHRNIHYTQTVQYIYDI